MGKVKKLFKRLLFMVIIYYVYMMCWALLFVYIEDCLPGKEPYQMSEKEREFINHITMTDTLSDNEKQKFINTSMKYHQSITRDTRSCDYGISNLTKWSIFAIMSCTTIGFGYTVPKTELGKVLTMILSIIGIPFQLAVSTIEGELVNIAIDSMLTSFEVGFLKRPEVKNISKKRLIATIILTIVVWILWALYLSIHDGKPEFIDCMYYIFQIITTIGYGDIVIVPLMSTYDILSQSFTAVLGMCMTASLVSSACSFIRHMDAKQTIRRISFSKTWSLGGKEKGKEQQKKHAKELFRYHEGRERDDD